jgi:hypothetical protein
MKAFAGLKLLVVAVAILSCRSTQLSEVIDPPYIPESWDMGMIRASIVSQFRNSHFCRTESDDDDRGRPMKPEPVSLEELRLLAWCQNVETNYNCGLWWAQMRFESGRQEWGLLYLVNPGRYGPWNIRSPDDPHWTMESSGFVCSETKPKMATAERLASDWIKSRFRGDSGFNRGEWYAVFGELPEPAIDG